MASPTSDYGATPAEIAAAANPARPPAARVLRPAWRDDATETAWRLPLGAYWLTVEASLARWYECLRRLAWLEGIERASIDSRVLVLLPDHGGAPIDWRAVAAVLTETLAGMGPVTIEPPRQSRLEFADDFAG